VLKLQGQDNRIFSDCDGNFFLVKMFVSFVSALAAWSLYSPMVRSTKVMDRDCPPHGFEADPLLAGEETGYGGFAPLVHTPAGIRDAPQEPDALGGDDVSQRVIFPGVARTRARFWLHITKCGTSFANTILHTPSTCSRTPTDFEWDAESRSIEADEALSWYCPELIFSSAGHFGSHDALRSISAEALGNSVTLLRDAEQRILSSFHDNYHDWVSSTPPRTELEYAKINAGCQVRMVVRRDAARGDFAGACMQDLPTEEEVALARTSLRRDFSFVGVLEEYDLSVCLFRVMFGGPCLPIMFSNVHKAGAESAQDEDTSVTVYDTDVLQGFVDLADRALYGDGVQIFHEMLMEYNVSEDMCHACYRSQ